MGMRDAQEQGPSLLSQIKIFLSWMSSLLYVPLCSSFAIPSDLKRVRNLLERMQVFFFGLRQTTTFFGAEEFVENWVMAAKRGHPLILAWQALFNGYWNSKSRHSGRDRDGSQC